MPGVAKIINDNHCADPHNQISSKNGGSKQWFSKHLKDCCNSCFYCCWSRAATKERPKSRSLSDRNKACQKCFFCLSLSFCPSCTKCVLNVPSVAESPPVGGRLQSFSETWLSLGSNPRVVSILKDGYNLPFKMRPPLTRSPMIVSGYANPHRNKYFKEALQSLITKQAVHSSQTKQQMASNLGFEQTQSFPPLGNFQNRNSRDNQTFPSTGGMGHIARFQRCLFPYSHQSKEVSQVSSTRSNLPVHGSAVRPSDSSLGIYKGCEGGETDGPVQGYKDPPVPRRLVASSPLSGDLCKPNLDPDGSVPAVGVGSQFTKVGTCAPTGVQLCWLSFRPLQGSSKTHSGEVASPNSENKDAHEQRALFCPRVHVSHRVADSHRETGGLGSPSHETDSVALEESLACARGPREEDSSSQISVSSSAVVARRRQCAQRPTASSSTTCSAVVYRRLKRRLGRSLRRLHGKRSLVRLRKPFAHKLSRTKSGPSGAQEVRVTVLGPDHFDSHGQHNGCLLHQQGGEYGIRLTLCPALETAFLVQSQTDSSKGQAHSGKVECETDKLSRNKQVIQTE